MTKANIVSVLDQQLRLLSLSAFGHCMVLIIEIESLIIFHISYMMLFQIAQWNNGNHNITDSIPYFHTISSPAL